MTRVAVAALIAALAVCGSAAAKPSPASFIQQTVREAFSGQFDREWQTLHPAQQKIVTLDRYVTCSENAELGELNKVDVVDDYAAPRQSVPGTSLRATSRAITVKLTFTASAVLKPQTGTFTFHAYWVDGGWRWALQQSAIAVYKHGRCP